MGGPFAKQHCSGVISAEVGGEGLLEGATEQHGCPRVFFFPAVQIDLCSRSSHSTGRSVVSWIVLEAQSNAAGDSVPFIFIYRNTIYMRKCLLLLDPEGKITKRSQEDLCFQRDVSLRVARIARKGTGGVDHKLLEIRTGR
jgi:hypothetical protein